MEILASCSYISALRSNKSSSEIPPPSNTQCNPDTLVTNLSNPRHVVRVRNIIFFLGFRKSWTVFFSYFFLPDICLFQIREIYLKKKEKEILLPLFQKSLMQLVYKSLLLMVINPCSNTLERNPYSQSI